MDGQESLETGASFAKEQKLRIAVVASHETYNIMLQIRTRPPSNRSGARIIASAGRRGGNEINSGLAKARAIQLACHLMMGCR
jgi:hypothetical protein